MMIVSNRSHMSSWLIAALLCIMLVFIPLSQAFAQQNRPEGTPSVSNLMTVDRDGNAVPCSGVSSSTGALGRGALVAKIVPCLAYTIEQGTIRFTEEMVRIFRPLLYSFVLFVIVLFGLRVLQNEPQIYKQGFLLLLKISLVVIVLNDLGGISSFNGSGGGGSLIPSVYAIMNESLTVVTSVIDTTSLTCELSEYDNGQALQVWPMLDCVLGQLMGFSAGSSGQGSMFLAASAIGLLSGFLFSGSWGVVVFFAMLGVLLGIFMLVVRAVGIFISSYLLICLMLIMSPLLMPLVFLKGTQPYFEKYWKTMLGGFLSPIIMTAYLMLALMVYDSMLFAPNSIVQRMFNWDAVSAALETDKTVSSISITNEPDRVRADNQTPGEADIRMRAPTLQDTVMNTLSGSGRFDLRLPALQPERLGPEFDLGKESIDRIFMELISLCVMSWLIHQGLGMLPRITSQLTGVRSVNMQAMQQVDRVENQMRQSGQSAFMAMKKAYGAEEGKSTGGATADFVRRNESAQQAGMDAFMQAMKKK